MNFGLLLFRRLNIPTMAHLLAVCLVVQIVSVMGMCGFTTCKDSEVCCCNATSGQSGFCVDAGSDTSVCTGSTMCPDGDSCCAKELEQVIKDDDLPWCWKDLRSSGKRWPVLLWC